MRRSSVLVPALFAGWTAYVWGTRVHNAWNDVGPDTTQQVWATALAASFLLPALGTAWAACDAYRGRRSAIGVWSVRVLVCWTVIVWVVRIPQIALADHSVGFIVVHVVLGLVSIFLAIATAAVLGSFRRSADRR